MIREKKIAIVAWVALIGLGVVSCLMDEQADAGAWMAERGYPARYEVRESLFANLRVKAQVGRDSLPFQASRVAALGEVLGSRQELFAQLVISDTAVYAWLRGGNERRFALRLFLDSAFYAQADAGDSLPFADTARLVLRWSWRSGYSKTQRDSLNRLADSLWNRELLRDWVRGGKTDSTELVLVFSPKSRTDSLEIILPQALTDSLSRASSFSRLVLQLSLRDAQRVYRFSGPSATAARRPVWLVRSDSAAYARTDSLWTTRLAQVGFSVEEDGDSLVLHGGIRDSLMVELPVDTLNAWLGNTGTERFVLRAELVLPGDTGKAQSELNWAVPVLAFALIDSLGFPGSRARVVAETAVLDSARVKENGHFNLLYYRRDSVTVPLTAAMRAFVQGRSYGVRPRLSLRLGRPMLSPHEVHNSDYQDTDSTWVRIYSDYPAYARWNLGPRDSLRVNLRLWWTDRGGVNP